MKKILLLGGGGHCHSVYDSILASREYEETGIVLEKGADLSGAHVVGTDEDLPELKEKGWEYVVITVGSIGNTAVRRRLYETAKKNGLILPAIIDPTAILAKDVRIGEGSYIGKRAVVNAGAQIGCCSIINTAAVIEHDCRLGDFVHVSTGAALCGEVSVAADTHIGAGSVVRQQITIGAHSVIGVGSVVVSNVPEHVTAYGNPCRVREE